MHDVLPQHLPKVYATVPSNWLPVYSFIAVSNPAVLSYHSRDWMYGSPVEKNKSHGSLDRSLHCTCSFVSTNSVIRRQGLDPDKLVMVGHDDDDDNDIDKVKDDGERKGMI